METINWKNILRKYDKVLDAEAKKVDKRFYGWVEYLYYFNSHFSGWYSKHPFKTVWEQEFLDEYFKDKEEYLKEVTSSGSQVLYVNMSVK